MNIGFINPAGDLSNVLLPLTGALPRGGKELCTGHNGPPGPIGGQVMHWHWLTSLRPAVCSTLKRRRGIGSPVINMYGVSLRHIRLVSYSSVSFDSPEVSH